MSRDGYYQNTNPDVGYCPSQPNQRDARILDSVLPEESSLPALDVFGTSDSFHLNVAAHDSSLACYPDQDDFMRSGVANPNEVQPPNIEFKRMSLDDIQDPIQLQDGPIDFDRYLQDPEDFPHVDGAVGFTPLPLTAPMTFDMGTCPTSINHSNSRDSYPSNLLAQSMEGPSSSLHFCPAMSSNLYHTSESLNYSQLSASHSQYLLPNTYSEAQDNPTNSTSRKGYRHRHERVYGLPEEDQKMRSQLLNNEASQLYRQRKTKKVKDAETQLKQEEERNAQLKMIYKQLQEQKRKLRLGQGQEDWQNIS
ncbi:uncharacterized protein [Palaemon carinicauda]|uniref:uncharacterized protein n=1 Tax=Palaemon carinicauda TaxID=392227 RepID=UPI0035B679B6